MVSSNMDEAIRNVIELHNKCKETLEKLNELQNDELFVSIIIPFGDDGTKITEWIFENNIVAKWENIEICVNHTELRFSIPGFRFRNKEDAMAFKLRWI